jgi:hypothetical protein
MPDSSATHAPRDSHQPEFPHGLQQFRPLLSALQNQGLTLLKNQGRMSPFPSLETVKPSAARGHPDRLESTQRRRSSRVKYQEF